MRFLRICLIAAFFSHSAFAMKSLGTLPDYPQGYKFIKASETYFYKVNYDNRPMRFMCQLKKATPCEMWIWTQGNKLVLKPNDYYGRARWFKGDKNPIYIRSPIDNWVRCFSLNVNR